MKAAELRRQMRAQRRELRRSFAEARRRARAKLNAHPVVRREHRKRWIRRGVLAGILAVLALLSRCNCSPRLPPQVAEVAPAPPPAPKEPPKVAPKKHRPKPLQGDMDAQRRGAYPAEARDIASWIDDFRLQVSARSTRLAGCFTGIDKPGALRWITSVNAESGAVSDHELEALVSNSPIGRKERECLVAVLSNPSYKLKSALRSPDGLPQRVSIVIEF